MAKWADFLISAVRYEGTNILTRHISYLKVHKDKGDKVGIGETWTRQQVVGQIKTGYSFITIFKNAQTGKWDRGEDVRVFTLNGVDYLRTDANRVGEDNLENLPEF